MTDLVRPETPAQPAPLHRPLVTIRVGIAHPSQWVAQSLASLFVSEVEVVAEIKSSDVSSSAEHLVAARPDVLFICADRGSPDPAELLEGLATRGLRRPTVALACRFSDYVVWRLCKLQIRGAIEDAVATRQNIAAALSTVNSGLGWFSPDFRSRVHRLRNDPAAFPRLLSNRQVAVLRCIAHGLRNDEIGDHLSCAGSTAKRHRADLMRKLGVPDSVALTFTAHRLGFADLGLPPRPLDLGTTT